MLSKLFATPLVRAKLDSLAAAIGRGKRLLDQASGSYELAKEHLRLAGEIHQEALTSLQYNNSPQAWNTVQPGIAHAEFAEELLRRAARVTPEPANTLRPTPAEEIVSFLSSALSKIKMLIEFASCVVDDTAQHHLDNAMNWYNDALSHLRLDEQKLAKRAAQAGLLELQFASELLRLDNPAAPITMKALANPMLGSPIRKMPELSNQLSQLHSNMRALPAVVSLPCKERVNLAFKKRSQAIASLAEDNIVHAQALVADALLQAGLAQEALAMDLSQTPTVAHVPSLRTRASKDRLAKIRELIADAQSLIKISPKSDTVCARLDTVLGYVTDTVKASSKEEFERASTLISCGIFELDAVRQLILSGESRKGADARQ